MRSAYTMEGQKGSYTMEAWTIVLIRCCVLSIIMIPTPGSMGKFQYRGNVEKVLLRGRVEECAYPWLGIEHHNDSYAMEAWKVPTPWKCGEGSTPWKHGRFC